MTPREELAGFLGHRAYCFMDLGRHRETCESFMWAINSAPDTMWYGTMACATMDRWERSIRERLPKFAPDLEIKDLPRQFLNLDRAIERKFVTLSVVESLLNDPELAPGWEALRRDPTRLPHGMPRRIRVQPA